MKNKLFLLGTLLLATTNIFANDIWFISPKEGDSLQKEITIQIQPPYGNPSVTVWIEYDMGREQIVWRDKLTPKNNYTTAVDTSNFKPGKYEIQAEYYQGREDYDGDVEVWIGISDDPNGQYFPQQ